MNRSCLSLKSILVVLLGVCAGLVSAGASEKPNTVLIHPGEVLYVKFERLKGGHLKVISSSKTKDDQAQVILHFDQIPKEFKTTLTVENHLEHELAYQAEARSRRMGVHRLVETSPVVEGKMSIDSWPVPIEEMALFGWGFTKYQEIPAPDRGG